MKTTIIRTLTVMAVTLIGTGASIAGGGNAGFGPLSHVPHHEAPAVTLAVGGKGNLSHVPNHANPAMKRTADQAHHRSPNWR